MGEITVFHSCLVFFMQIIPVAEIRNLKTFFKLRDEVGRQLISQSNGPLICYKILEQQHLSFLHSLSLTHNTTHEMDLQTEVFLKLMICFQTAYRK